MEDREQLIKDLKKQPFVIPKDNPSLDSLQVLMKNGSWQNIVNMTGQLLAASSSQLTEEAYCFVMSMRFESLFRLKMYDDLNIEVGTTLEKLQSSTTDNRHSVGFIFAVKMLQCEIKMMTGHSFDATEQLMFIRNWLRSIAWLQPQDFEYWEWQSTCHLVNCNIRSRNWKNSIRILRKMLVELHSFQSITSNTDLLLMSKTVILLRLAKLFLQIGATTTAKLHYQEASSIVDKLSTLSTVRDSFSREYCYIQTLNKLTKGLLLFGDEKFHDARTVFDEVIISAPFCIPVEFTMSNAAFPLFYVFCQSKDESLLCTAVNNYSICSLHLKQNLSAIEKIENLISEDPVKLMTDSVVFNLCTMYDLSYSPEISTNKKKLLQKIAGKYNINDPILHWRSFRLS